jgi:hypothetical protein
LCLLQISYWPFYEQFPDLVKKQLISSFIDKKEKFAVRCYQNLVVFGGTEGLKLDSFGEFYFVEYQLSVTFTLCEAQIELLYLKILQTFI